MSVIIYTKSLSAGYRKRKSVTTVLRNVDLELHEGELVSLLGANGAGKSTLIRTICGLQPALAGRVMVGDKDVERLTPRQLSKTIALVTTERTFAGGLTVSSVGIPTPDFWDGLMSTTAKSLPRLSRKSE